MVADHVGVQVVHTLARSRKLLAAIIVLHQVVRVHRRQGRVIDVQCLRTTQGCFLAVSLSLERLLLHRERLLLERVAADGNSASAHDALTVEHVLIGQIGTVMDHGLSDLLLVVIGAIVALQQRGLRSATRRLLPSRLEVHLLYAVVSGLVASQHELAAGLATGHDDRLLRRLATPFLALL